MIMARAPDVGMKDRRALRGPLQDARIEVVVEDRLHRAVGVSLDLERPQASGLDALASEGLGKPDDAKTGSKALLGMRPVLENEVAQGRG